MSAALERADLVPYIYVPVEVPLPTDPPEKRVAWLAERRNSIGGSDAAAACAMSPYEDATPLCLYRDKRGEAPERDFSDNKALEWGNRHENTVAEWYTDETGRRVQRVRRIMRSREWPFMHATLDRRIVGESRLLEIKTTGTFAAMNEVWGDPPHGDMPVQFEIQIAHQLAVTGYERADLAVLIGGNEPRIYERERNEKMIANIVTLERAFWDRVQRGDPPPPMSLADLKLLFPQHVDSPIEADAATMRLHDRYRLLKGIESRLKGKVEAAQFALGSYMGENNVLTVFTEPVLTWNTEPNNHFDAAALKADDPALHARYLRKGTKRVFRLKGLKKKK